MGNDTSVISSSFRNGERDEHAKDSSKKTGGEGNMQQASTSSKVVEHNKKDVKTHHGLILQRFDSADWMMMKNKLGVKSKAAAGSSSGRGGGSSNGGGSGESSPLSKLSKETSEYAKGHTPKLKPSAPNEAIGSPCRSSPLGK